MALYGNFIYYRWFSLSWKGHAWGQLWARKWVVMPNSYRSTHPWICFQLDLRQIPSATWILLGEASSKIEHVCGAPLRPATSAHLNQIFLAKGAHATTAIEGNTLSEDEVRRRVEGELVLPDSQAYLGKEVDNIIAAYNHIIQQIVRGLAFSINPMELKQFNRMVLTGLEVEEGVRPGEYRSYVVGVGDYRSPEPDDTEDLVRHLCEWLNHVVWTEHVGSRFVLPVLRAIAAHLYIAWIHPFGDGNGRTARLVEFDILTRAGVPTVSAHLLSTHYNRTRSAYYRALSAARSNPVEFVTYAVAGFVDGLREQIAVVRDQQLDIAWRDFVYQAFDKEPDSPARSRRRELLFSLSDAPAPVRRFEVAHLTPVLASAYTGKTPKTITRDVNALVEMGLVQRTREGLVADKNVIRAFLPLVNVPERERQLDFVETEDQIALDLLG